jgi:hypothetical protein
MMRFSYYIRAPTTAEAEETLKRVVPCFERVIILPSRALSLNFIAGQQPLQPERPSRLLEDTLEMSLCRTKSLVRPMMISPWSPL